MRKIVWLISFVAVMLAGQTSSALADGRLVALVTPVVVDPTVRIPAYYSGDGLRRELEIALEATGLFTVPTRERRDLDPVLQEVIRTHKGSSRIVGAQFILEPTIEAITLDQRRRLAPSMRNKDLVTVTGSIALRVTVLDAHDGSVKTRMSVDVRYNGPDQLADPLENDPLAGRDAVHLATSSSDFVLLSQATGRAFAKRVLDQVNPALVAQADDSRIYITRGQEAGYQLGETLRVIRRGAPIINPVTKEVLGQAEQEVARAKVIEVQPRMSIAEIVQSTHPVITGDIVREPVGEDGQ